MQDQELGKAKSKRPYGRSLPDFLNAGASRGLHPAEERLLAPLAKASYELHFSLDNRRPEEGFEQNRIRAAFIRFLALGGDDDAPIHEKGIRIHGAYIEGDLDLEDCEGVRALGLWNCTVTGTANLTDASTQSLLFDGCLISEVIADRVRVNGNVFMRNSTFQRGVSLRGARIGGNLHFTGSRFQKGERAAIDCGGIQISGNAHLDGNLAAEGEVNFAAAKVGSHFNCDGGTFRNHQGLAINGDNLKVSGSVYFRKGFLAEGAVRLRHAEIGHSLGADGGTFVVRKAAPSDKRMAASALALPSARIEGNLWLRSGEGGESTKIIGSLNLRGAFVRQLCDDRASQPVADKELSAAGLTSHIFLDGLTYDRFGGGAPVDYRTRETWLRREPFVNVQPQPFEQLVKVLREMGHDADARRIAMLKHSLLRPTRTKQARWYFKPFVWFTSWAWGLFCGYGYRPHRLIVTLLALWLVCGFVYKMGAGHGGFGPKDPQIWTNSEYNKACDANWLDCKPVSGGKINEMIAFNAFTFSADMLLPAIDLGQRSAWAPMWREVKIVLPYWGEISLPPWTLRAVTWVENILGVSGVILVGAILSGIIKRD